MKTLMRSFAGLLLLAWCSLAAAAVNCTLTPNPAQAKGAYGGWFSNVDIQGSFDVRCTRARKNDQPQKPDLWIGVAQPAGGNVATLDTGGSTVAYTIYHRTYGSGVWLNTGNGVAWNSSTNGAVYDSSPDFGGQGLVLNESYSYFVRADWSDLIFRPAGVYVDSVTVQLRLGGPGGTLLDTANLDVIISLPKRCRFNTPPTPIDVNYQAFSPTPVTGQSSFVMTCTQGTDFQLSLDQTRSVIPNVELAYGLSLSQTDATGTAVQQGFTVDITIDPGQAGRCNGAVCSGTDRRTLTISY